MLYGETLVCLMSSSICYQIFVFFFTSCRISNPFPFNFVVRRVGNLTDFNFRGYLYFTTTSSYKLGGLKRIKRLPLHFTILMKPLVRSFKSSSICIRRDTVSLR